MAAAVLCRTWRGQRASLVIHARTMLSYQHAYHAGGLADLHKHAVLAGYLDALVANAPKHRLRFIDTHAGRGMYNLRSDEALKTGDATRGMGRCSIDELPSALRRAVLLACRHVKSVDAYPGSPFIASALFRPCDELLLYERHPGEHAALRRRFFGARARVVSADGPAALLELAAAERWRPGLVLVDPSYELAGELSATAEFVRELLSRWRQAAVLVWHPILHPSLGKDAARLLIEPLAHLRPTLHEVRFPSIRQRGLEGSGLLMFNATVPTAQLFTAAEALVHGALARAETGASEEPLSRSSAEPPSRWRAAHQLPSEAARPRSQPRPLKQHSLAGRSVSSRQGASQHRAVRSRAPSL